MQKFDLDNVVATPAALHELAQASVNPLELIVRHSQLNIGVAYIVETLVGV